MSALLDHAVQVLTFRGSSTGKLAESLGGDRDTVRDVEQARQAWRKRGRPPLGPREAAKLCLEFVRNLDARKQLEQALQSLESLESLDAPPLSRRRSHRGRDRAMSRRSWLPRSTPRWPPTPGVPPRS